jgi:GntR family transcriptional repressor for pyruvate dehydrogenase complex
MKIDPQNPADLSAQIASAIRDAIVSGALIVDQRLPSEAELSEQFEVSRPTGATGGAFVNRISFEEAYSQQITTSTLLLSMNAVSFETACEARYALERACAGLSAKRRTADHLATMRAEIHRQSQPGLTDEAFCASDVAFHRALVDGAGNPVMSYQLAGAVEAMQPLMNMITFSARDRARIVAMHGDIADAMTQQDAAAVEAGLTALEHETQQLAIHAFAARSAAKQGSAT